MLSPGRYLLGALELALLAGFAGLGGAGLRSRLLPRFSGPPAWLATAVLALALLVWAAEALGTLGLFEAVPYLACVAVIGVGGWALGGGLRQAASKGPRRRDVSTPTLIGLAVAALAVLHFAAGVKTRLGTGMTGFDSTWYHGPFAAGFFQSGDTWSLHYTAPQFLAWFYPANSELLHAAGMLAFGRDILSPPLNLGWLVGCLLACWCIGRPYGVAPWSLALGAVALSVPALGDQAGEARNDVVGIFFLLAAVAIAVTGFARASNARHADAHGGEGGAAPTAGEAPLGALLVAGLAAGMAAGTKLNFLLPAAAIVVGLAFAEAGGRRRRGHDSTGAAAPGTGSEPSASAGSSLRALCVAAAAALAGGGYWYLRNLAHAGNPLPWVRHLGPVSLPAPEQALGGREAHSVLSYIGDRSVWSGWFLPGLHHGLWAIWPLLLAAALAGLLLGLAPALIPIRGRDGADPGRGGFLATRAPRQTALAIAGVTGLAAAFAWLVAPTSASGPEGMPRGYESGLRYLAPALVLGLALLPASPPIRGRLARIGHRLPPLSRLFRPLGKRWDREEVRTPRPPALSRLLPPLGKKGDVGRERGGAHRSAPSRLRLPLAFAACLVALAVAAGYPVQRHYLQRRYADPGFAAPGLNAAFAWARDVSGARIATTSTRQYPLFGADLSNRVQYVGVHTPHGGFVAPSTCRAWRRLLAAGDYDYVVASRDRLEPHRPPYPPQARWTRGPAARVILREPPTVVFSLNGPLAPSECP